MIRYALNGMLFENCFLTGSETQRFYDFEHKISINNPGFLAVIHRSMIWKMLNYRLHLSYHLILVNQVNFWNYHKIKIFDKLKLGKSVFL